MSGLLRSRSGTDSSVESPARFHAYLVQDFYTWGGQLRDTDTGPGRTGITHCRPQFIPAEAVERAHPWVTGGRRSVFGIDRTPNV